MVTRTSTLPRNTHQYNKMIEVPVEHHRQAQVPKVGWLEPDRAGGEAEGFCHLNQGWKGSAFERDAKSSPQ
jgi:hypothetical protein